MSKAIIIEVTAGSSAIQHMSGTTKDGRDWERHFQKVYAHVGAEFPMDFEISIDPEKDPELAKTGYTPGLYTFAGESYTRDRTGRFTLDPYNMKLVPTNERPQPVRPTIGGNESKAA